MHDNNSSKPVITPKTYGRSIKATDLPDAIVRVFPVASSTSTASETTEPPAPSFGLPRQTLLPILKWLLEDVADIREALQGIQLRMVGASLLIVYEADWECAAEGVKAMALAEVSDRALTEITEENEDDEEEGEEAGEEEEATGQKAVGPPFIVKLIDFAHTRMKPGEGPDQGVLLGLETMLKLLNGRVGQLRDIES